MKKMNVKDINYVRSVLSEKTCSCVADGDLESPEGSRAKTRSGFRAWLRRAEKQIARENQYPAAFAIAPRAYSGPAGNTYKFNADGVGR